LLGASFFSSALADPLVGEIANYPDWQPELEEVLETVEHQVQSHPPEHSHEALLEEIQVTDPNTGSSGSLIPHIPEPMHFDLIRPLGARQGELEVNSLFLKTLSGKTALEWAPEIEYAILDNHAIEFELPFESLRLETLKAAYQVTLGTDKHHRLIHGLQGIGKYDLHTKKASVTGLYIVGCQLNERWSALTMVGLRHSSLNHRNGSFVGLLNPSLFYTHSKHLRFGLETNLSLTKSRNNHYLYLPQVHLELGKKYSLQIGAGFEHYSVSRFRPVVGMRLIREM
jgi:hypothetical protein